MSSKNKQLRAERAAALMAERERAEKRRRTLVVAGVVLGLVLIVGVGFAVNRLRDTTDDVAAAADSTYGLTIGSADAPRDVLIYEDFLCPACAAFEAQTNEGLAALAADGEVRVTYFPFVLLSQFGDYSERTTAAFGVVLEESGPEVAKEFHDLLYANQPSESGPFPDDDWIVDLAVEAGADEAAVGDDIRELAGKDHAVGATAAAEEAGVQSTPTILLDGEVYLGNDLLGELE